MIMQFPVPYQDELLSSILARYIHRQGIRADKQALELLFGSRNVVPSSLFQGHIESLHSRVGHLWQSSPEQIIANHTLLGVFKPFLDTARYVARKQELIIGTKNQSQTSIGVNASKLIWPSQFRYCPICLKSDLETHGESYWRRHFQLPGVTCCPIHSCLLVSTDIDIRSSKRHRFVPVTGEQLISNLGVGAVEADLNKVVLARQIYHLLNSRYSNHSVNQWSTYYQNLAHDLNLMNGRTVDHQLIRLMVLRTWGSSWLNSIGLGLEIDNNWLLAMLRKHRRPFSYLHHLTVMISLLGDLISVDDECRKVDSLPQQVEPKTVYTSSKYNVRKDEYRIIWLDLMKQHHSLQELRATREGARVYSWLYRFDHSWYLTHSFEFKKNKGDYRRIDWAKRDRKLVKQLVRVEQKSYFDLSLPRKSIPWFAKQINATNLIPDKLTKLPLCHCFMYRYQETVDEYQVRRLLAIVADFLNHGQAIPPIYELERSAGLSKERIREPAKEILRVEIPRITCQARFTREYQAYSGSRNSYSS
ncbi:TnsD family Tn7-like transposition protein [Vibrio sp. RC27]